MLGKITTCEGERTQWQNLSYPKKFFEKIHPVAALSLVGGLGLPGQPLFSLLGWNMKAQGSALG